MNWTSRPQLISFIRDHRSTLPHAYALRTARPGLAPDSFCLTKATTEPQFVGHHVADDSEQVNMAFESGSHKQLNAIPNQPGSGGRSSPSYRPDSFAAAAGGVSGGGNAPPRPFAQAPRRSDSLPSPSSAPPAVAVVTGDEGGYQQLHQHQQLHSQQQYQHQHSQQQHQHSQQQRQLGSASAAPLHDGYDQVVFQFTKVPAEDFARDITLMFLPVFTAIQPDELTSVAWHGREKEVRAPNVVKFTRVFNHVNFWVQKCILETASLSNRAAVLGHFVKIAKRLLELQNLHGTFAVVAALQSQPIFRLKRTWGMLARKHVEAFERLTDLFSANNNHERLRKFMQDVRQPVIPYLGLYMNDLVYIDTCHPSTGGLESQARKDKMNNICRVLSDYQQSQYNFQSKEHVRRYLEGQTYIEEMQSFVEAANYKTSMELEPHSSEAAESSALRPASSGGSSGGVVVVVSSGGVGCVASVVGGGGAEGPLAGPGRGRQNSQSSEGRSGGGHRKSKSFGDAAAISSVTPSQQHQQATVQRHLTIGPNSVDIHRNLIDDSPAFASGCAGSPDSSYCGGGGGAASRTPGSLATLNAANSSSSQSPMNVSSTPLMGGGGGGGHVGSRFPHTSAATGPAPNRQLEEALSLAPVICQGALQRKAVYKSGKKQSRASYVKFWAELVITENGSHPLIRLFAAGKPFASERREDYKRVCKKQQDLTDASVVVFENSGQCSDPEHTFQINFDLSDHSASFRLSSSDGKFCSYKFRTAGVGHSRDQWVAQIKLAIQQSKKEKALIDFEEDQEVQRHQHQHQLRRAAPAASTGVVVGGANNNRSENSLDVIEESSTPL